MDNITATLELLSKQLFDKRLISKNFMSGKQTDQCRNLEITFDSLVK